MPSGPERTILERIHAQGERVHLPIGALCNNNCQFCMESNRHARADTASQMTLERAGWVMEQHRGAQELCFTSGEPTTREDLEALIALARAKGFARISLMTNARRLSYAPYAARLVRAGLNRVYVSIHGDTAASHESLTRTPGSFAQTVKGISNLARLKRSGASLSLNTSTVVTRRNVGRLAEMYGFLRGLGVDDVVFNALQITGGAERRFATLVPRYGDIRREFVRVLEQASDKGTYAFLVDVPLCITHGVPDRNRGYVERHLHYEASEELMHAIHTSDLDEAFRTFGKPCEGCGYRGDCPGVYKRYVDQYGWEEFGLRISSPEG